MAWGRAVVVFVLGWALARWILPSFYPFVFALIFAAWVDPLVDALVRAGLSRALASFVAIVCLLAVFSAGLALLAGGLVSEAGRLLTLMPHYNNEARRTLLNAGRQFGLLGPGGLNPKDTTAPLEAVFAFATEALGQIVRGLGRLPELVLGMAVAVVAAYFLARDKAVIVRAAEANLPASLTGRATEFGRALWQSSAGYVKAQLLLVLITFALTSGGLFVLGSPYAVVVGLLAGVLDLVPLLGPTAVLLPWGIYLLLVGVPLQGVRILALLALVVGVREVVESKVVGQGVGLHPLVALAAMYLGVRLFGPFGVAYGPILVAAAWAMARRGGRTGPT